MRYDLTVTHPFGDRQRGDRITDKDEKAAALAEHAYAVVRVPALPAEPKEEAEAPDPPASEDPVPPPAEKADPPGRPGRA